MKRFCGWEPATVYEYDDAGRLARSTPEPEWDEQEQAWMLALVEYRAGLCPCGCGLTAAETQVSEGLADFRVPPPVRCQARDALSMAQEAAKDNPRPEALLWRVERRR